VLFALAVTASVQLVGVYLVFTTLIVPAWPRVSLPRAAPAGDRLVLALRQLCGGPGALGLADLPR
jgi:hypothetical protein